MPHFRVNVLNIFKNPKNIILFFILITMVSILFFFLKTRSDLISTPRNNQYEIVYDSQGNELILKHKSFHSSDLPTFMVIETAQAPERLKANYDLFEYYGIRVISTGKFSTTTIKNNFGLKTLAKVLQLEVQVDDEDNYLEKSEPFNIALRIYPDPNIVGKDIAPSYLMNILQEQESQRLAKEFPSNTPNELNSQLDEVLKEYGDKGIGEGRLEQIFKEGTAWIVVPYIKDDLVQYTLNNTDAVNHQFAVLSDRYYSGRDSNFFKKVFSKKLSGLKEPVVISDLALDDN